MQVGDKVTMQNMWKYAEAHGVIKKITSDYVVVSWDGIPGEWHYTEEQSKRLEVADESR